MSIPGLPRDGGLSRAQVEAAIAAATEDVLETYPPHVTAGVVGTWTADAASLVRVRAQQSMTITKVAVYIGTASGNIDVGIYTFDGTTMTRLGSTGSTAAAGTNAEQELTLTTPVAVERGTDYWFAFVANNTTVTAARVAGTAALNGMANHTRAKVGGVFPLPATITGLINAGLSPYIVGRP